MTLRAATFLGDNTRPLLDQVVAQLRDGGINIEVGDNLVPQEADLVFACGLLTRVLISRDEDLDVIAAPVFPGETNPVYRSILVTRTDGTADLESLTRERLAVNEYDSWSGWHSFRHHVRLKGLVPNPARIETGSHRESMAAVRAGTADLAAIDSSIWRFHADNPIRDGLARVETTADWPAPPISIRRRVASPIRDEISAIITGREDFEPIHAASYDEMFETINEPNLQ